MVKLNKKNVFLVVLAVLGSVYFLMGDYGVTDQQTTGLEKSSEQQAVDPKADKESPKTSTSAPHIGQSTNANTKQEDKPEENDNQMNSDDRLSYVDALKQNPNKNSYHEKLIKDHDRHNRYPEYNQRIESIETDPIERSYELDERTAQSEDGEAHLTIWTDKKYYLHGDEVVIYAILEDARGVRIQTRFMGQLIFNETENLQLFEFTDENLDGVYEHRLTLAQDNDQLMSPGIYKVLIVNEANEMVNAVAFTLSQPELELTGNFKDTIDSQGSLIVQAEVEVTAKQRFYFQASLYSSTNDPIGVTQYSTELTPGRHWVPLSFDGLMIRDVGEPGPYLLKSISLAKVAFPMQRAPLVYPEFYTQGYTVDQFKQAEL